MKALVVYHTRFGNTEGIARAVAAGLEEVGEVRLLPLDQVTAAELREIDILVVGCPTQRRGPTKELTAFLESLPEGCLCEVRAAAFDTRYHLARLVTGSAACRISKMLLRLGASLAAEPASFFIASRAGPPEEGERERAARWARSLGDSGRD